MAEWKAVITNRGLDMLEQIVAGSTMTLTKVVSGKGTVSEESLPASTSVSQPMDEDGSVTKMIESGGLKLSLRVYAYTPAQGATQEGYTMKQIGLYAKIDNGADTLFAIMQNTTGIEIPLKVDFPDFAFNAFLFVESSAAANIQVEVDPDALVTEGELNQRLANVVELTRKFVASGNYITCPLNNNSSYIVFSSGSSADGIDDATSGCLVFVSNGKYSVLKKGTGISVTATETTLTVQSGSGVALGRIQL